MAKRLLKVRNKLGLADTGYDYMLDDRMQQETRFSAAGSYDMYICRLPTVGFTTGPCRLTCLLMLLSLRYCILQYMFDIGCHHRRTFSHSIYDNVFWVSRIGTCQIGNGPAS